MRSMYLAGQNDGSPQSGPVAMHAVSPAVRIIANDQCQPGSGGPPSGRHGRPYRRPSGSSRPAQRDGGVATTPPAVATPPGAVPEAVGALSSASTALLVPASRSAGPWPVCR